MEAEVQLRENVMARIKKKTYKKVIFNTKDIGINREQEEEEWNMGPHVFSQSLKFKLGLQETLDCSL